MTVLSRQRIQCDRCLTVFVLTAKRADHWGAELFDANWVARPRRGGGAYPSRVFAHNSVVDPDVLSELSVGGVVNFRIRFNRTGPCAVDLKLGRSK
jgi:hypothetical protein